MTEKFYVGSVEQCMSIIMSLGDDISGFSNDDKRRLYLARTYYIQNDKLFSDDQKDDLFNKKAFLKNIPNNVAGIILDNAVLYEKTLPIALGNWFNSKDMKPQLLKYLDLVIKDNNKEQLQTFCDKGLELTFNHYKQNQSALFSDILIEKKPEAIVYNTSWSDKKIINWLEQHQEILPKIAMETFKNKMQLSMHVTEHFFSLLSQQLIKDNKDIFLNLTLIRDNDFFDRKYGISMLDFFSKCPTDLLVSLESRDKHIFQHLIQVPFIEDKPYVNDNQKYHISFLQKIYISKTDIKEQQKLLYEFESNLFKPVVDNDNFYEKKISFSDFLIESGNYAGFAPMKDNLSHYDIETQKMYVAANLSTLHNIYNSNSAPINAEHHKEHLSRAIDCLTAIDYYLVEKSLTSVKDDLHKDVYSLVSKLVLKEKLNAQMPENNNKKRSKI